MSKKVYCLLKNTIFENSYSKFIVRRMLNGELEVPGRLLKVGYRYNTKLDALVCKGRASFIVEESGSLAYLSFKRNQSMVTRLRKLLIVAPKEDINDTVSIECTIQAHIRKMFRIVEEY